MKVLHTIASIRADHGGPTRNLTGLSSALTRHTPCQVHFLAMVPPEQRAQAIRRLNVQDWTLLDEKSIFSSHALRSPLAYLFTLRNLVERLKPDLIHDHGIWLPNNHYVARMARSKRIPRVVNLLGMATPWTLSYRRTKKRLAWLLFQRRDLLSADLIQAASEAEAMQIRALGLGVPIAVMPYGVELPATTDWPASNGYARALFLSRLHPKKNVDTLLRAWAAAHPPGWTLRIVGPSELGYREALKKLATELGIAGQVTFVSEVSDAQKWQEYRAAQLFILPSNDENFGIVVPEALAAGRPVIATTGTPWQSVLREACGWWVDPDLTSMTQAIQQATATDAAELKAMGQRGREFVAREFAWSSVAQLTYGVYQWLLYGGARPACVMNG